jgi:hypothetical protein
MAGITGDSTAIVAGSLALASSAYSVLAQWVALLRAPTSSSPDATVRHLLSISGRHTIRRRSDSGGRPAGETERKRSAAAARQGMASGGPFNAGADPIVISREHAGAGLAVALR